MQNRIFSTNELKNLNCLLISQFQFSETPEAFFSVIRSPSISFIRTFSKHYFLNSYSSVTHITYKYNTICIKNKQTTVEISMKEEKNDYYFWCCSLKSNKNKIFAWLNNVNAFGRNILLSNIPHVLKFYYIHTCYVNLYSSVVWLNVIGTLKQV